MFIQDKQRIKRNQAEYTAATVRSDRFIAFGVAAAITGVAAVSFIPSGNHSNSNEVTFDTSDLEGHPSSEELSREFSDPVKALIVEDGSNHLYIFSKPVTDNMKRVISPITDLINEYDAKTTKEALQNGDYNVVKSVFDTFDKEEHEALPVQPTGHFVEGVTAGFIPN